MFQTWKIYLKQYQRGIPVWKNQLFCLSMPNIHPVIPSLFSLHLSIAFSTEQKGRTKTNTQQSRSRARAAEAEEKKIHSLSLALWKLKFWK
jgi:hypothetical protein